MLGWKDVSSYSFNVVLLFESIQIKWLLNWKDHEVLSVLLHKYPVVSWFMKHKAPNLKKEIEEIELLETTIKYSKELETNFINGLEDWIIYAVEPNCYDEQPHNNWDTNELLSITDFNQKTVIDIGSGTGSQVFRVAPFAKEVFAVEPVANLRRFIKEKAHHLGHKNIYIVDGTMTDLPYPNEFADIVMSGHVFGDYMEEEYVEMERVCKKGGLIILIPGNNDEDNNTHTFLTKKGFDYGVFEEPGDGLKRKYFKTK